MQRIPVITQSRHGPAAIVFHQHIGLPDQGVEYGAVLGVFQVDGD